MPRLQILDATLASLFPEDKSLSLTVTQPDKSDNLFGYMKLTEDDVAYLMSLTIEPDMIHAILNEVITRGYAVKFSPETDGTGWKASLTGTTVSGNALITVTSKSDTWMDALVAVFYKVRLVGYPMTYRMSEKTAERRNRFA